MAFMIRNDNISSEMLNNSTVLEILAHVCTLSRSDDVVISASPTPKISTEVFWIHLAFQPKDADSQKLHIYS